MIVRLARTPGIYLVGFMGTGKSTVGRLLADRLGWNFVDLDEEIEAEQRMKIAEIFDRYGEEHFRQLEREALRRRVRAIQRGEPTVMALGGGAFAQPDNYTLIEENGISIWLDCPLELARKRVEQDTNRPLARDPEKFVQLYEARRSSYARADFRVEVTGDDPGPVVEAILQLPIF
ncbi:MAG: shikimate kinase [Bryobacteraceae bacterium]